MTAGAALRAHALDEYVQATRIAVTSNGVVLSLGMTPGVAIAPAIVDRLDRSGDGTFSAGEAEVYGRSLIADLDLTLDGAPLPLSLVRVEVPTAGEMREGRGTIDVEVRGDAAMRPGRHRLVLRNAHLPAMSVYLANALRPESSAIRIVQQTRDERQQTFRLDFDAGSGHTARAQLGWLLTGTVIVASLVGLRRSALRRHVVSRPTD
jgi:hypothetical protein